MDHTLTHHGIFGMKWGVRRFQNKDGSLTSAGKTRYSRQNVENDVAEAMKTHKEATDRVMENGPKITEYADKLGKAYDEAFNNYKLDEKTKSELVKKISQDFDDMEEDDFDWFADDYINDRLIGQVNKQLQDQLIEFQDLQDKYWEDVHTITDDVRKKYENVDVRELSGLKTLGRMAVSEAISNNLDTSWNSYISRHFDDYWVYDTDAHYGAVERIKKEVREEMFGK